MSHTVSGQTTSYTWDVGSSLPVVLKDNTYTYVYGLDLISATDGGGAQTYFLYDGLGSTTDLTDGNATVTATYSYDVFGAIRSQSGTSSHYWLFTGEQRDADGGVYYLRARYYDPAIGRFLTTDPVPLVNRYVYAQNNPVSYLDPSGMFSHPKLSLPNPVDVIEENIIDPIENQIVDPIEQQVQDAVHAFETGYIDVGGTVCGPWFVGPCITLGAQFGAGQGLHPYFGGGAGSWGGGVGVNLFPGQRISEGVTCGFQGSLVRPIIGMFGPGVSGEVGISGISVGWKESRPTFSATPYGGIGPYFGTPGVSGVCYYVFRDIF